jgi:hypothetical protein
MTMQTMQTELALVHRLMHDLDSVIIPGQHDLQQAAMLSLSALATGIKLRHQLAQLHKELNPTPQDKHLRLINTQTHNEHT